ncbi:unnamed protein product [Thelazia callipaeda]|uniref:CUB domain-containing protein n=1 Tax=Thelazia callipaeda TaxID=103827 RepID=A0A0N5D057_THECL|nr:unnamed protein product [Thelazia callipaeda]
MHKKELDQLLDIISIDGHRCSEFLVNSHNFILLSSKVILCRILLLYLFSFFHSTYASLASCRCVHFNFSSGIFQSPNFPNAPLSSSLLSSSSSLLPLQYSSANIPHLCLLYKFTAPNGYIIEITFDYFHFSSRTDRCFDYLRLFDGISHGLIDETSVYSAEFCAKEIEFGQRFYSYSRYFIFHLHISNLSKGFHGNYNFVSKEKFLSDATEIEPCRFRVDSLTGNIFSPNYPYFYPSNANCTFYLTFRREFNLEISLKFINLRRVCHEDFIDIYQMHPKVHLEKLCYDSMPPYRIYSRRGFIIEFRSGDNNKIKARGFHISYEYIGQQGLRKTTNENKWKNDLISNPYGYDPDSVPDSVLHSAESLAFINFLNDAIPIKGQCPVRISSPSVAVTEHSRLPSISGILNSTHFIDGDDPFKCQFIFLGSGTERVQITFFYFNLYSRMPHLNNLSSHRCDEMDHLSAHVLIGTRMSRIEDFCGTETPPRLMSTKNLLTLDYVVRSTGAMRRMMGHAEKYGFVLRYHFRSDLGLSDMNAESRKDSNGCKVIVRLSACYYEFNSSHRTSGDIFSPNHPGYYPRNIDCHYIFHGTEKQIVAIHFEYFDVEGFATYKCDDSTHSDYVLFSNYQTHDRTNRRYCGQVCPRNSIVSESNYFRMLFRSNDIFDATGFYAHYQFITERKFIKMALLFPVRMRSFQKIFKSN